MPITTFQGVIANQSTLLVNARELHQRLQVKRDFSTWLKSRIDQYGFVENEDFTCSPILGSEISTQNSWGGNNRIEYHITLNMAKELCMLERSELGQQARRYFIKMEQEALQARQALQNVPQIAPLDPNQIQLSKDKYIALLEKLVEKQEQTVRPQYFKRRLTLAEKRQIISLHQQGLTTYEICQQVGRSDSAVRATIHQYTAK